MKKPAASAKERVVKHRVLKVTDTSMIANFYTFVAYLFPEYRTEMITKLWNSVQSQKRLGGVTFETVEPEVQAVCAKLKDSVSDLTFFEPFAGTGTICQYVYKHKNVVSFKSCDFKKLEWKGEHHTFDFFNPKAFPFKDRIDCIICSPPFELLDLALAYALRLSKVMVIMHVPLTFPDSRGIAFANFIADVRKQHICREVPLAHLGNLRGRVGPCKWFIVFIGGSTPYAKRRAKQRLKEFYVE